MEGGTWARLQAVHRLGWGGESHMIREAQPGDADALG